MSKNMVIILNGVPRSGKSSIAKIIQNTFEGKWINLGVDQTMATLPQNLLPGIGLRPGGERPDLEDDIVKLYKLMYMNVSNHCDLGYNVVVDVGHHDNYSKSLNILKQSAQILENYKVYFIGIKCTTEEVMNRRRLTWNQSFENDKLAKNQVSLWQEAVHNSINYDLVLQTDLLSSQECAEKIHELIQNLVLPHSFKTLI